MTRLAVRSCLAAVALAGTHLTPRPSRADAEPARVVAPPDRSYSVAEPVLRPSVTWALLQLVPSPQLAFGTTTRIGIDGHRDDSVETSFGLGWQLTPVLWSFGMNRRLSPFRFFVVDPLARVSGSIELHTTFDWFGGHVDALFARPGVRVTLPLYHHGEYLALSFGTSVYHLDTARVAYDAGVWILAGAVGVQATVAPAHAPLATIAALRLRYF